MNTLQNQAKILDPKAQRAFFVLCWFTHFSTYLGRLNFAASLAEISGSTGFSKADLGMVASGLFIGYGIFQLVWGIAGDHWDPVRMVFTGIFCSGVCNLLMPLAPTPAVMTLFWTLNGVAQSGVWSPLLRLTVDRLPGNEAMRASVRYATIAPAGTFAAYIVSALCALVGSWRAPFFFAAAFLFFSSFFWLRGMKVLAPGSHKNAAAQNKVPGRSGGIPALVLWMLVPISLACLVNGFIRDGVQTWMPSYLLDSYGLDSFFSILFTLALPLLNLSGAWLSKVLNEKVFHNELLTAAVCFGLSLLLLAPIAFVSGLSIAPMLLLSGFGTAMMLVVNVMLVTLVPLRFQNTGRVSTLSGVLNSVTYLGSALSGRGAGRLIESFGWSNLFKGWCIAAGIAALICLAVCLVLKKQDKQSA